MLLFPENEAEPAPDQAAAPPAGWFMDCEIIIIGSAQFWACRDWSRAAWQASPRPGGTRLWHACLQQTAWWR